MLDIVTEAVREAGSYVLNRIGNYGEITSKSPTDFVTEVDKEAERLIVRRIRKNIPHAAFYGEEFGRQGNGKYLFVIDPIDATTNYIRGIPLFDISVAVYESDENILGVVACPKLDELYIAERGSGAYLNEQRINVSSESELKRAIVGWNRSNHPKRILEYSRRTISKILEDASTIRIFGTGSLDYCYLAKGSFDACVTPLAEPFHSAGYIIMEEAGAIVTDCRGNPHRLESETIVAANPILHAQILGIAGVEK